MKVLFVSLAISLSPLSFATNSSHVGKFSLTVVNLTKGQPITPSLISVHKSGFEIYRLGEVASVGLQIQAKDGATDLLESELSKFPKVLSILKTEGVVLPGQKTTIEFSAESKSKLSMTAMLARTNDGFVGLKNLSLPAKKGQKLEFLANVYDAGAEENTELCSHIPAPPCNSHFAETDTNEGIVTLHPGIQNIGDLNALRDAFGSIGAKVIIEKL
ncbi:hypothetical protein GW916_14520 [bacterium]|nr:hypothetical protein [bacterium]